MDHTKPRVIAEYGPGEGCHTREIARRMHKESRLLLFELDGALCKHLRTQFVHDPRISVHHADCADLPQVLEDQGLDHCDYILSGIPFSILDKGKKREILTNTHAVLRPEPHAAFIIYQVTNELRTKGHCDHFATAESEYCLINIPPMFVTKFYKHANEKNGHPTNGLNGHSPNGHKLNGKGAH